LPRYLRRTRDPHHACTESFAASQNAMTNRLYYGANLDVLREHIADDSIDLVS
jgi:hypothetical protein